jgi:hypothetical protein
MRLPVHNNLKMHKQHESVYLMCTGPCIIVIDEEENSIDPTQYFIALVIGSTCFRHHYAHHQEL